MENVLSNTEMSRRLPNMEEIRWNLFSTTGKKQLGIVLRLCHGSCLSLQNKVIYKEETFCKCKSMHTTSKWLFIRFYVGRHQSNFKPPAFKLHKVSATLLVSFPCLFRSNNFKSQLLISFKVNTGRAL